MNCVNLGQNGSKRRGKNFTSKMYSQTVTRSSHTKLAPNSLSQENNRKYNLNDNFLIA